MIKQFIFNALNSWVTSAAGTVIGLPEIWGGLKGLLDEDPATGVVWKTLLTGAGILFMGLMTRDWTKGWLKSDRNPDVGG